MIIHPEGKIKNLPELRQILAAARSEKRMVVFGNGCFDLIHVGHIRYLEGAKALGNLLVVAINSDASVRAIKGEGRPLQPESERAEIIASFACVDYVILFDELTVAPLLEELRPDIHAKGTDYTPDSVPERETVSRYGGKVAIVGDPKDHSSRDLIGSILAKSAT
jgi:rfaE bifunctional protein nucleotidyltransferase chain/domain